MPAQELPSLQEKQQKQKVINQSNEVEKMKAKEEWIGLARQAMKNAYVPYSDFPVGACLVADDNTIFLGVNVENASIGLTNCAERTAVFKAVAAGYRDFQHLVVVGNTPEPIAPCGACRQVLLEFCKPDMPVTLVSENDEVLETTIGDLMPYGFTREEV